MLNVTLLTRTDPTRTIQAIKAVRAVALPTEPGTTALGLKGSKNITDDVRDGRKRVIQVAPGTDLSELRDHFTLTVESDGAAFDRETVIDFLFSAVATAPELMHTDAFKALRASL